jgi:hypothetical protein
MTTNLTKVEKIVEEIVGADAEARRQAEYVSARFDEFNEIHCIIYNYYGKGVVYGTLVDGEWIIQAKKDLMARYEAEKVKKPWDGKWTPIISLWLGWPKRKAYERVTFVPGGPMVIEGKALNLWRGWGVEPKEGSWDLMKKHLLEVVCKGRLVFYNYLMDWMAWSVQNPEKPAEIAVVLVGLKGSGKTTVGEYLIRIFGHHTFQINTSEDLTGRFNAHAENCVFLLADDQSWRSLRQKDGIGRVNSMITSGTLQVERKGVDKFNVPNRLHIMLTAEPGSAFPAGPDERRYAPFDMSPVKIRNWDYFRALRAEMEGDGPAAALFELQRRDLRGWHPREVPKEILESEEMVRQKLHALDDVERWWLNCLTTGELPGQFPGIPNSMISSRAVDDIRAKMPRLRYSMSTTELGNWLNDAAARGWRVKRRRTASHNGWLLPTLSECRKAFEEKYGPQDWPVIREWIGLSEAEVKHREFEEIMATPIANIPMPPKPSQTEEEREAKKRAVTDKLCEWVEKHHGPPKQYFVRDGNGDWRRREEPAAGTPDPDGLEPKAGPISPDGPLATILKMPIASIAAEPAAAKPWRRF